MAGPGTEGAVMAPWSVSALGYGKFLTDIFDEWVIKDVGAYFVQAFDRPLQPGLASNRVYVILKPVVMLSQLNITGMFIHVIILSIRNINSEIY